MDFSIIVAADKELGIGKDDRLPWDLPTDLQYFSTITRGRGNSAVIMGRKTWESLPAGHQPLEGRLNIVLTRSGDYDLPEGVELAQSLDKALRLAQAHGVEQAFVIGGGSVFKEAIEREECKKLYITEVQDYFDCDTFFPEVPKEFKQTQKSEEFTQNSIPFRFAQYEK